MLDESQGLLQEGNLSRYSGPLSLCVPSVRCICLPGGGALPQDGLPLLAVSPLITHLHPPYLLFLLPLTCLYLFLLRCNVPCLSLPSSPPLLSSTLTPISSDHPLCHFNLALPPPPYQMAPLRPWGPRSSACVSCGFFRVDVPSTKPASLPLVPWCFHVVSVSFRLLADQIGRPALDTNLLGQKGTGVATK